MRLGQLFEPGLGLLVARVQVGVMLPRQLAESRPDLLLARRPGQAQNVVVVLGLRHLAMGIYRKAPAGNRLTKLTYPGWVV